MNKRKYDILIIGSGLGGLICGAVLAKSGYEVVVLEQSGQIGGCIQSYKRGNAYFDTGLHYVGGLSEGLPLHKVFSYLGLMDLPWQRMDDCFDLIRIGDKEYPIMQGWENFVDSLSQIFPHQRQALQDYAFKLQHITPDDMDVNAWDYLHRTFSDELLINVLSASAMKLELRKESLPLFNFAHAQSSYIEGSWRLKGNGNIIVNHLRGVIEETGGMLMTRAKVVRLNCDSNTVQSVELADGRIFEACDVISDIHPQLLSEMLDGNSKGIQRFVKRNKETENTFGMFTASLLLKPNRIRYINKNIYIYDQPNVWNFYTNGDSVSGVMVSMRIPEDGSDYVSQIDLLTPMLWDECQAYSETRTGHRTKSYHEMCHVKAQQCIRLAERAVPGLADAIERTYTSTPLTYRDYLCSPQGNAFGTRKDNRNPMLTFGTVKTPLQNLFLTGQTVCLPGIEGVTMTAFDTCKQILGNENISDILR